MPCDESEVEGCPLSIVSISTSSSNVWHNTNLCAIWSCQNLVFISQGISRLAFLIDRGENPNQGIVHRLPATFYGLNVFGLKHREQILGSDLSLGKVWVWIKERGVPASSCFLLFV
jgi:hypothetical protein